MKIACCLLLFLAVFTSATKKELAEHSLVPDNLTSMKAVAGSSKLLVYPVKKLPGRRMPGTKMIPAAAILNE